MVHISTTACATANRLHQCVHHVVRIIRKIVACRFEQLCDLIFLQYLLIDCNEIVQQVHVL